MMALRRVSQAQWVIIAMVVGVAVGALFPDGPSARGFRATDLQLLSSVFLRMIKSLIVPLLFSTLVVGIAGHGDDLKRVGKLAFRSMVYFEVATTLALVVGLVAVNVVKPGVGVELTGAGLETGTTLAKTSVSFTGIIEHIVPQSFFDAAARNDVLQITFFAIVFAVALSQVEGQRRRSCSRSARA